MIERESVPVGGVAASAAGVAFAVIGGVAALFGLYLVVLSIAAFFYRAYRRADARGDRPHTRVVVLVPAHNEERQIGRCVESLAAQTYPADLYETVVIADNCTDATEAAARAAGARVLVRNDPDARGKGRALRWAIDQILERGPRPHAVAVVDADSIADEEFLAALVRRLEAGAEAVQGESLLSEDGRPQSALRAAAFLLVNRVRPAGRAVLGLPCHLAGNGMLFRRELLAQNPWDAFTSTEDIEYAIKLRRAGVRPAFAGGAILRSPTAPNPEAAAQQQLRWEGGKLHVARTRIPQLLAAAVRERRPSLFDAAFDLAVPPLGLLAAGAAIGATAGGALAWRGLLPVWAVAPWVIALASIPCFVLIGLVAARAPASAYRALLQAPLFVVRKALRAHRLFGFRADSWVRTERASEQTAGADSASSDREAGMVASRRAASDHRDP